MQNPCLRALMCATNSHCCVHVRRRSPARVLLTNAAAFPSDPRDLRAAVEQRGRLCAGRRNASRLEKRQRAMTALCDGQNRHGRWTDLARTLGAPATAGAVSVAHDACPPIARRPATRATQGLRGFQTVDATSPQHDINTRFAPRHVERNRVVSGCPQCGLQLRQGSDGRSIDCRDDVALFQTTASCGTAGRDASGQDARDAPVPRVTRLEILELGPLQRFPAVGVRNLALASIWACSSWRRPCRRTPRVTVLPTRERPIFVRRSAAPVTGRR
jgi:hypothetical protein